MMGNMTGADFGGEGPMDVEEEAPKPEPKKEEPKQPKQEEKKQESSKSNLSEEQRKVVKF